MSHVCNVITSTRTLLRKRTRSKSFRAVCSRRESETFTNDSFGSKIFEHALQCRAAAVCTVHDSERYS
jgi:hypothetical protein